jgi:hypothetical protein
MEWKQEYGVIFVTGENKCIQDLKSRTTLSSWEKPKFEFMGFLLFSLCFCPVWVPNCIIASTIAHACEKFLDLTIEEILLYIMKKKGVLQLALQLNFWVALDICNSPYLYAMSAIKQVARVVRIAIHHIYGAIHYNSITILSQLFSNYYATPLWLQP